MMIRFIIIFLVALLPAIAADRIAASLSPADVQAAMDLAVAGDRVVLPAGTANWTSGVTWTAPANVTLVGAGTTATGGGDQTVITDNIASDSRVLHVNINASGTFRMTGITFQGGTGAQKDGGTLVMNGPGSARIDHCRFYFTSGNNYKVMVFGAGVRGVMDSCVIDFTNTCGFYFLNGRTGGGGDTQGNYEWTQPTAFGTSDYFFLEDNDVIGRTTGDTYGARFFDSYSGGKVVVRFNSVVSTTLGNLHATGHAGDDRGARSLEYYGNIITSSGSFDQTVENPAPNFAMIDLGSGTALAWGNSAVNVYKHMFLLQVTRRDNGTYTQSATPNGWGYAGTAFNGTGSNWDGGTFNGTDTTLGYPAIDQPGRGAGDLLTGLFPNKVNDTTGTIRWPNQALEPIYIWANVGSPISSWGGGYFSDQSGGRVVADRDYYPQASGIQTSPTSPFNGTTGTGWGTLANRPTTCTTGVAYWATDQGDWNQSASNPYGVQQNGADGVLYVATATNTWTLYYEPYTYPHPLRGASTGTFTPSKKRTLKPKLLR